MHAPSLAAARDGTHSAPRSSPTNPTAPVDPETGAAAKNGACASARMPSDGSEHVGTVVASEGPQPDGPRNSRPRGNVTTLAADACSPVGRPHRRSPVTKRRLQFDEIGYWSEVKLDIIKKYARAYSTILAKQKHLTHYYIDGFAGAGIHRSRTTGGAVPGSPLNALDVRPGFKHYFLVDLDGGRVRSLQAIIGEREDVTLYEGNCNEVLVNEVFPRVRYSLYRRALCLLDPYGLQLDWRVVAEAGRLRTIDLFLNFPIMGMNRNALWRNPEHVGVEDVARMTAVWGDESWRHVVYQPAPQGSLFGDVELEKQSNEAIVGAFRNRLRDVAGFKNVPDPMPMRNSQNAVVYYLFFASPKDVANKIVVDIFRKYASKRSRHG
jgi:three-Cys-motif partner protein